MSPENIHAPLGRASANVSATSGKGPWRRERVAAVALVPLTIWFIASIVMHLGSDYLTAIAWLRTPFAAIAMILLLIALFYHTALGLRVVIEDYVHSGLKQPALRGVQLVSFALTLACIVAILRIVFGK